MKVFQRESLENFLHLMYMSHDPWTICSAQFEASGSRVFSSAILMAEMCIGVEGRISSGAGTLRDKSRFDTTTGQNLQYPRI